MNRRQRYVARQRGEDVPKLPPGFPSKPFWSLVEKGQSCWLFHGRINRDGYGVYTFGGRTYMAHRFAWSESRGELQAGAVLMHCCDVPACVNPDHLSVGTHAENQADKTRKGRQAIGIGVHNAILTDASVRAIRERYRPESSRGKRDGNASAIAAEFGISRDTLYRVIRRTRWRHVA